MSATWKERLKVWLSRRLLFLSARIAFWAGRLMGDTVMIVCSAGWMEHRVEAARRRGFVEGVMAARAAPEALPGTRVRVGEA